MKKTILVMGLALISHLNAEERTVGDWTSWESVDDFTDERVVVARTLSEESTKYSGRWSLFVNCRGREKYNVGITSDYVNPTGGDLVGEAHTIEMKHRFDDLEPYIAYFVKQEKIMFYDFSISRRLDGTDVFTDKTRHKIAQRITFIFLKQLSQHNLYRLRFPQHGGAITLRFSLEGAKEVLTSLAEKCELGVQGFKVGEVRHSDLASWLRSEVLYLGRTRE